MKSIQHVKGTFGARQKNKKLRPSAATIRRLPRYYRYLSDLLNEGVLRISSSELAKRMRVTASQIRQDLSCFGDFGQQGYGYNVKYLWKKVGDLLGLNSGYRACLIGVGNLGQALLRSNMFARRGVECVAAFDTNEDLVGTTIGNTPVLSTKDLETYCQEQHIDMAVLSVPTSVARQVADRLVTVGIHGILNFTNAELVYDAPVQVENVHLDDALMVLCFRMGSKSEGSEE